MLIKIVIVLSICVVVYLFLKGFNLYINNKYSEAGLKLVKESIELDDLIQGCKEKLNNIEIQINKFSNGG